MRMESVTTARQWESVTKSVWQIQDLLCVKRLRVPTSVINLLKGLTLGFMVVIVQVSPLPAAPYAP
jgi:hypothetical protein